MTTTKRANTGEVDRTSWEEIDRRVAAARFNGTLPLGLLRILEEHTEDPVAVAREIASAYTEAWRAADAREALRTKAVEAAKRHISDLGSERKALSRRLDRQRAASETEDVSPTRIVAIASGLAGEEPPPADLTTSARDADRLEDLDRRIAEMKSALAHLDGRGRPATAARMIADRLAPIWRRLTASPVTASRSAYEASRFSGFELFFRASIEWLTGKRPSPTLTRSVAAAIANSAENPEA